MLSEDLQTPMSIRERAAAEAKQAVGADEVFFFTYALVDGVNHYTSMCGAVSHEARLLLRDVDNNPSLVNHLWEPSLVPLDERNRFQNASTKLAELEPEGSPILDALYHPLETSRTCRTRLYDGRRFLGYLGCMRRGRSAPEFTPDELARLDAVAERLKSLLLCAERLEGELPSPAYVLFDRDRRALDFATPGVRRWFTAERVEQLRAALGDAELPDYVVLDNHLLRPARVDGDDGPRVMVSVEQSPKPTIDPRAKLTPAQRRVAEFAACGATNQEIADHLDISIWTVKTHVKNIYERLGVASRLELSQMLEQ